MPTRILLADDFPVVLEGLQRILDLPEFHIVGAVLDGRALVKAAGRLKPDIIVLDVSMAGLNGIEAMRQIREADPEARFIFLSMHRETFYAVEALRGGAAGFVVKNAASEELLKAVRQVRRGGTYVAECLREAVAQALRVRRHETVDVLTPRQREVLQLIAEGKQAKEIAAILKVSPKTVEFHKCRMKQALNITTLAELVTYAARRGIHG